MKEETDKLHKMSRYSDSKQLIDELRATISTLERESLDLKRAASKQSSPVRSYTQ